MLARQAKGQALLWGIQLTLKEAHNIALLALCISHPISPLTRAFFKPTFAGKNILSTSKQQLYQ
jgi:hypothetical protein